MKNSAKPYNPYLVLGIGALLPGIGQLMNGSSTRALRFIFFIAVLAWVSSHLAHPNASFVGRHAGGFFIYALSLFDSYKWARIRHEEWKYKSQVQPA